MKVLFMAGLFTVAAVPFAGAAEASAECQVEDTRRAQHVRIDNGAPGGSAPTQAAQPTSTQREAAEQAAQRDAAQAATARVAPPERRRNGKRIPDAELIGPRGAL